MNPQLEKLYLCGKKPTRIILGLMSGTSLDGLDIACCEFTGSGDETEFRLLNFKSVPYTAGEQETIRKVFARKDAPLEWVCMLNRWMGSLHAGLVNKALAEWGLDAAEVDLIASHGQTIFHAPAREHPVAGFSNSTLQIGDGDQIAQTCGIITLSDFRQKHIAAGGEGAPLAVYGDFLLLNKPGKARYLINIGGISNFTCLPAESGRPVFATDTGPGNTLSDALVRRSYPGLTYDKGGELALEGMVLYPLLVELKKNTFFTSAFPKTTGPEQFSPEYLDAALSACGLADPDTQDILATLSQLVADTIFDALLLNGASGEAEYFLSGGGVYNEAIVSKLKLKASWMESLHDTSAAGLDPDAKEAALFAALANEAVAGDFSRFQDRFGSMPAVTFGKISLPG